MRTPGVVAQSSERLEARHRATLAHSAGRPPAAAPAERPGCPGERSLESVRGDDGLDRILTAPNVITLVRLLCIPLFLWLLFGAHRQTAAAVLLGVLGATDWVDGYVARRFGQVSTLGKVLDPTADRLLVGTAVISIMVYGAVPALVRRRHHRPRGARLGDGASCWPRSARHASTCCGWARRAPSA